MKIQASIATAESDAALREREWQRGRQAALEGKTPEDCPWTGGPVRDWWLDGFANLSIPGASGH